MHLLMRLGWISSHRVGSGTLADKYDRAKRSQIMSAIRGKDTKPELMIRQALYARGFRYRLHVKDLPGRPDIVMRKRRAVIFVHGCFWHGHDCHLFRLPESRVAFWKAKFDRNQERDHEVRAALRERDWRMLVIWECSLRGRGRLAVDDVIQRAVDWLNGTEAEMEIRGQIPDEQS